MRNPTAGILGTGLIGSSIGLGLIDAGWDVAGWDPDRTALQVAWDRNAITQATVSLVDLVSRPLDLLVLAGPPGTIPATLSELDTDVLVTDVAGIKSEVVSAGAHLAHYVPSHPMAGREVSGPASATRSLFRGASWIVLASTLITEAEAEVGDLSLVGGSFRDLTRVAASDPHLWSELLTANRPVVVDAIERFGRRLQLWAELLDSREEEAIVDRLADAARIHASLHTRVGRVDVSLEDRPGEIAAIGRALEQCGVDVRDLQLRHSPYGGGGLLQLFVRDQDVFPLRQSLAHEGLIERREQ